MNINLTVEVDERLRAGVEEAFEVLDDLIALGGDAAERASRGIDRIREAMGERPK